MQIKLIDSLQWMHMCIDSGQYVVDYTGRPVAILVRLWSIRLWSANTESL